MHAPTKLRPFEFRLRQRLGDLSIDLSGRRVLVACSGGADSVALVHLLRALSGRLKFTFALAHIHHGITDDPGVLAGRIRAQKFVETLASDLNIPVLTNDGSSLKLESQSESSLRDFRKKVLNHWRDFGDETVPGFDKSSEPVQASTASSSPQRFTDLAFGHHADDLLETRLMRLIRGTGALGLSAMSESRPGILRPLLTVTRNEIRGYLRDIGGSWVEDSSNLDVRYFRNWIRHNWLPQLEAFRPGAAATLANSLQTIVGEIEASHSAPAPLSSRILTFDDAGFICVDLVLFRDVSPVDQQREMAKICALLLGRGLVREFKATHVREILKRLDTPRKVHSFSLLGLTWEVIDGRLRIVSVKLE